MSFALGLLAVIGLFVSVLFVVSALFFLIRVPNRLEEISFCMRKLVALLEKKPFDDDPSDDGDDGMRYF